MAHYAFLDENNIVTEVIPGKDENELIDGLDPETWYGNYRGQVCKRTSYNGNIRYNYAGIGYTYDADADAFIAPRPICGHKELFLNDSFIWNCQRCELDIRAKELADAKEL
jgi:hypothetical protein